MTKARKPNTTVILWTVITFSFVAVIYSLSGMFGLESMIARAEKRELDGHFRNLGMVLAADPARMVAFDDVSPDVRNAGSGLGEEGRTGRPHSGIVTAAYSAPFRQLDRIGGDLFGMPRAIVLNGDGQDPVSGLEPAAGTPAFSRINPVLDGFKEKSGVDAALFAVREGKIMPAGTTLAGAVWLTGDELRRAAAGETILREHRLGNRETAILAGPVHDLSGRRLGVAVVAHDRAKFAATVGALRTAVIGVGLLLLFVTASIACAVSAKPAQA
ncbi:hypothetical protein [Shumkonia mesophila]|uniref:hypothetical protein n=1 Tax=Shumkonia mesophila TaxID=2838854 RepID=UPI0029342BB2|nr:hypothetical protein [Shumkonia mesophila]